MAGWAIRPADGTRHQGIGRGAGMEGFEIGNDLPVRSVLEESTLRGCREDSFSSAQSGEQLSKRFRVAPVVRGELVFDLQAAKRCTVRLKCSEGAAAEVRGLAFEVQDMDEDLSSAQTSRVVSLQQQERVEAIHRRSTRNTEKVKRLRGPAGEGG